MGEEKIPDLFSQEEIQHMATEIDKINSRRGSEEYPSVDEVEGILLGYEFKDKDLLKQAFSVDELEQILGYKFKDKDLLKQAFTHGSYKDKLLGAYRRLENYGDSVLNLMIARYHYRLYPNLTSGELTKLRAANIETEKLARVAVKHNLDKYLRHKNSPLHKQMEEFKEAIEEYPLHSRGLIVAPKVLADIVESTIGAIFEDTNSSLDITWKVAKILLEPIITPKTIETQPMTKFYELCQKHGLKPKFLDLWENEGAIYVFVDNEFLGMGICKPKRSIAFNMAVENAYSRLVTKMRNQVEKNKNKDRLLLEESSGSEKLLSLSEVEEIIGYEFKDKSLIEQAFSHDTCKNESSGCYERLEYLGDSVLNLLIAKHNYFLYPELPPGKLTRLRAANVDTEKLARAALKHNLHKYLRHRKPLLNGQIEEFMKAVVEFPMHSNGLIDTPKALADIIESTIGAIFLDTEASLDITWKVCKRLLEPIITPKTLETHPRTKLFELCQKHRFKVKEVDLWSENGSIYVFVDNKYVSEGIYRTKRSVARNRAANNAYHQLVSKLSGEIDDIPLV